ncbi:protein kinase C theta type-like [Rana temporaria]|uniref:protein kinase C theta type-like n=1 Tax=Rana temporaria TaxID=8407 RepID=UPI001AACDBF2|nr:protein kinase C theta type-like [Rana temporaria]
MVLGQVGDTEIAAPEIHSRMPYELAADYFALGILLFKAAFGKEPFTHKEGQLQHPILLLEPCYPDNADPILVSFLNKLLCKDPQVRKEEVAKIREDPFFNEINWKEVEAREAPPPFSIRRKVSKSFALYVWSASLSLYTRL